jgi:elongation factor Ts
MSISAQDVNKLRQMTGAGMMDCKKALTEANGDFEAAIDILRKKGQKVAASRADRASSEGAVFIYASEGEGFVFTLNCETDFVAKNEEFVAMGNSILKEVIAHKPADVEGVNKLIISGRSVADHLTDMMGKIGEKIEVASYSYLTGEKVIPYLHGSRIGVLVALKNVGGDFEAAGKDVAMQIAAMNPIALDKDDVPQDLINREIEIGKEQARAEGKAEEMLEKIAFGKLNKFYKETTLLNQEFVKDNKLSISQYLNSIYKGMTVSAFKRVSVSA